MAEGIAMHPRTIDITGLQIGYLVVREYVGSEGRGGLWRAECICGVSKTMLTSRLRADHRRGIVASCGCKLKETLQAKRTTHGLVRHPAYRVWAALKARCSNPRDHSWGHYGGRGITVCERWRQSFENFWKDMGPTYQRGLSIDRIDNDGNYEPGNCRWATAVQQRNNMQRRTA